MSPRTRRLRISWSGGKVTALLQPGDGPVAVLLAHGAGAGQTHRFMESLRRAIAAGGISVMTFDYAYVEAGRRAPDRMPRLLEVHEAAARRLGDYADRIVLAGKSMGGRVGSHLAGDGGFETAGLVYYGYPLVPLGKGEPRPTDHLDRIPVPQLFVAGTRDRLSPPPLIEPLAARLADAKVSVIEDADHGFGVPKRSGLTDIDVIRRLAAETVEFVAQVGGGR